MGSRAVQERGRFLNPFNRINAPMYAQSQCTHNAQPGIRVGQPLCIPDDLVRNGYYDCIGTVEACTARDEEIADDVAKCGAVVLDRNPATCTDAGNCKYWGVDVVSDFSDEKSAPGLASTARIDFCMTVVIASD